MEGIMASDISLAAGDGARRMTYTELATVRGTSQPVEMPPSQMAPDDRGLVRGLENAIKALQEQLQFANTALIAERQRVDEFLHQLADAPERAPGADPMTAIGIQTLSQACCARTSNASVVARIELSGKLRKDANGSTSCKPHSLKNGDGLMASIQTSPMPLRPRLSAAPTRRPCAPSLHS